MLRRPAHSGNAAVARFPRSGRHGLAPAPGLAPTHGVAHGLAPGLAHNLESAGTRSRCTETRSPPGPYHVADNSAQPRELTPALNPK